MKILELRFKNLNSLYGEWVIDFTDPEYVSNGIFALTGPTGSGKSTILDAVCLALYGATPRLGKITQSSNEIMSRQTGECYAEVIFESQTGKFLCHWEHRRARKKADGALQSPEHQIADADTGKPIETKKSLVGGVIEEKTGMDFDRFTRSMLLAQGGFDTFLKADIEQKSKILEQITGTGIYSEISRRVHERQRDEREKLNLLHAETSGIVIMEPEQEREIQQDLEGKQKQETELAGKSSETSKAITWLTTIDGLKKEIHSLTDEAAKLQSEIEVFKPERGKFEQAQKAASLDGKYATLTALRKQQSDDQDALKTEEAAFPELETSANTQSESLKASELLTLKTKEALKAAAPLIQKIRSLDQKIAEQAKGVSESSKGCTKGAAKIETDKQAQAKEQEKRIGAEKTLATAEQYLTEHAQDEWLISGLAGIEEQFGNLLAKQKEITQKEADLKNADTVLVQAVKKLEETTKQRTVRKQELEATTKNLQQGKDALSELLSDKLLREYRTEKETLLREMAFIKKIEELKDHRAKLEDGKACPLCGSAEHPYATGNIPVPDEIEQKIEALTKLITKAEDQEAAIKKLEDTQTAARKNLNDSEKLEANAANDKKAAEKALADFKDGLVQLRTGFEELKNNISYKLKPLGYAPDLTDPKSTIHNLKSKVQMWQEQVRKKTEIEKQIAAIEAQKKECHRWEKLHGLIGSADGKKYRNFAQGLTFELMVTHANRQLEKMTERYLLIRDEQQPLELNVVDNYQAGEIRSTKNLSGGESFIVSLTLALGLSKMASRKVRVDSLFLDEGFGTLDDESLETALETLSGLQQDGKLIGIISHVSALKERISTQINITPMSGGRSSLFGPGCTKVGGQVNG